MGYHGRLVVVDETNAGKILGLQYGEEEDGKVKFKENELNGFYFKNPAREIETDNVGHLYSDEAIVKALQPGRDIDIAGLKASRTDWLPGYEKRVGGRAKNGSTFYSDLIVVPGFSQRKMAEQTLPFANVGSIGLPDKEDPELIKTVIKFVQGDLPFTEFKQALVAEKEKEKNEE